MSKLKFLNDAFAIMHTELRQLKRNRTAILISLVIIPLFFTSSLGGSRGGATGRFSPTAQLSIAFVDNDLTVASGRLFEILATSGDFNNLIQGYRDDSALTTLGTGRILAAIIIPKGFENKLVSGELATITLYVDDGAPGVDEAVLSALRINIQAFNPSVMMQRIRSDQFSGSQAQIQIVRKGTTFSGFAVGLTIILALVIIFATFYEIAGNMARESEEGTYARLLASPVSLGSIMIGKTLYDLILNLIRTFIVLGLSTYLYGARLNTDLGTVLVISLLLAVLTMGFGFLISAIGAGVRAVVIIEFFLVMFLFAFSGFIIDRELLRGVSRTISLVLPWAYGIEIFRNTILMGHSLLSMTNQLQFIGISVMTFYGVAYFLLRFSRERLIK